MNKLKSRLKYRFEKLLGDYKEYRFKSDLRRAGVFIHSRTRIVSGSGIRIEPGTLIDPGAILCASSMLPHGSFLTPNWGEISIGKSCEILTGTILASYGGKIELGHNVSVNPYSVLYGHGGLRIGSNTRIASHTVIIPANHKFGTLNELIRTQGLSTQGITIGENVWIGTGVRVLDGVEIEDNCVVAAGAVVTKSIPKNSVVMGVPAKVVSVRQ
jgi:acetyltransferase-like isoleucine patch superfamily enzyme